ncbi:YxiG-like protein [Amycolatopsis japonica]|uniref:YxiG-like protein n=1 Tax=Amycolatopsis japonica TaxID=208439 RepID=UPI003809AEF9
MTRTGDPHATNGESARITGTGDEPREARSHRGSPREMMSLVDVHQISEAFDEVFDQALVFHGFTDYMRDYDVLVYATADPRTAIRPEFLRYRFKHCVRASVTSAVTPETWSRSLDDRLVDFEQGRDLEGYVWGVRWQVLYPGAKLLPGTAETDAWSTRLGRPFHEAMIEANGHTISLVFSDLSVDRVEIGYSPFTAADDGDAQEAPASAAEPPSRMDGRAPVVELQGNGFDRSGLGIEVAARDAGNVDPLADD